VLHVTSSAPETDFVVRLSRVTTAGRAIFLSLGACRAQAREGAQIVVQLDPVSVRFAAGEAIRIDVASSAFPLLIRNPNTGADPASVAKPSEFQRALQVVHHDAGRPSHLHLPALPA
jgi:putative CocE/NonD family hydrolase